MSNTTELFHPEHTDLALPAGTVVVFVDAVLCEDLEPIELIRGGWPQFSSARLLYNPAALDDARTTPLEAAENQFGMGRQICLQQLFNATPPLARIDTVPLFAGQIERIATTVGHGGQRVEFTAMDFSAVLARITVYGQHVCSGNGEITFLPSLETVFNPAGQGNAAIAPAITNGVYSAVFSTSTEEARAWTCAEVIHYLLSVYLPGGQIRQPGIEQLEALTERQPVRDFDATGLNLLEALHRCSELAGLQFRFTPSLVENGPRQVIVFYRNGHGRAVELNHQHAGELLSLSRTDVAELRNERAFHPLTHRYIGQGDFTVYEATFELVKAWDPALEDTNYYTFSASSNPEFHKVRDVFRKWCLNEAGTYSAPPYNRGEPYDFSPIFRGSTYIRRRRRFRPTLSADPEGKSLGYLLQVSFDGGLHWWEYLSAFNNLLDECGIWLSSNELDVDTWVAALKGLLRFRITASVVGDERLMCTVVDGPVGSTAPVVDHVITLPRCFQCRKVTSRSILKGITEGLGTPDEADDSAALYQFVRQYARASAPVIDKIEVQTPTLTLHFEPGDSVISSPDSRDVLGCMWDNRSLVWIDRVKMDIENQCTRLNLVRQRVHGA